MTRMTKWIAAAVLVAVGFAAHQASAQQPASSQVVRQAPVQVSPARPTRSYRSYSVNPARGDVRRSGPHSGESTWRHAGAKPAGHFANGK